MKDAKVGALGMVDDGGEEWWGGRCWPSEKPASQKLSVEWWLECASAGRACKQTAVGPSAGCWGWGDSSLSGRKARRTSWMDKLRQRDQWEKRLMADGRREGREVLVRLDAELDACLAIDNTSSSSSPVSRPLPRYPVAFSFSPIPPLVRCNPRTSEASSPPLLHALL